MKRLLDTNVILDHLGGRLAEPLPPAEYAVSVITEMELFSFSPNQSAAESHIWRFLGQVTIVGLSDEIQTTSVRLREAFDLKLPDAIVAATAICLNAELWTNDGTLSEVPGLVIRPVRLK